ncbi:hypothetical protein [Janibacter melonis]|uniref:hypothetical protein n=1 Tax=Janibacter melonis TaxID=262209 RepID=UPI002095B50E|nr:hypothetical protein [Janibacter melonis]
MVADPARGRPRRALLLGTALGCVVLTFAAADPEREVVGPLGYALLPVALVAAGLFAWRQRTAPSPLVPAAPSAGGPGGRSSSRCSSASRSSPSSSTCRCSPG